MYYLQNISNSPESCPLSAYIQSRVPSMRFFLSSNLDSVIQAYWTQVIHFLHDQMGSPVTLEPKLCLLRLLPDSDIDKSLATFVHKSLFLSWKTVTRTWMQTLPPALQSWKKDINDALPCKKLTCTHRGCPLKYEKVWGRWMGKLCYFLHVA